MESLKTLTDWAAAATALITIMSLFALLVRGMKAIIALPTQIRAYFFRPKFILIPTSEELAKYCVKSFESRKPTLDEIREEILGSLAEDRSNARYQSKARVVLLGVSFGVAYVVLVWRLIYFAVLSNQDLPRPALAATVVVALLLWFLWIINLLARGISMMPRRKASK